jgi:hypothetical protein
MMARLVPQDFKVNVFRPNGVLLTTRTERCTRSDVAKKRVTKWLQGQGRLAHFYKLVVRFD